MLKSNIVSEVVMWKQQKCVLGKEMIKCKVASCFEKNQIFVGWKVFIHVK